MGIITEKTNLNNQSIATTVKPSPTEKKAEKQKGKIGFWESVESVLTAAVVSVGLVGSAELQENMALAERGNSYLKEAVHFSVTNPERHVTTTPIEEVKEKIEAMRKTYSTDTSDFILAHQIGEKCLKYSLGDCGELSCAGWVYLMAQKNLQKKVDIFRIKNKDPKNTVGGDHAFVVIGRDPKSDPKKLGTWGESAVIWDPLRNTFFPAAKINLLDDYLGLDQNNKPISRSFNPIKQELALWASNDYTSRDIVNLVEGTKKLTSHEQTELMFLQNHLDYLHSPIDAKDKKEIKESLFQLLETDRTQKNTPFFWTKLSLIHQLKHTSS